MSTRTFESKPATREQTPLLIGLMGPSGGGKTYSALRLAVGIQRMSGGEIFLVDTEAKRALHYAFDPATGKGFKFQHVPFGEPFGSLDYLDVVQYCVSKGAGVIIIDSMSHEHEGPGGLLDVHDQELQRMSGGDWQKAQKMTMLAWQKPKADRRRLINSLLQINANFIFCFRAKEKMKIRPGQQPEELGYMPIAGEEFLFEQTVCCLLHPGANGVPTWDPKMPGEKSMRKLPEQFMGMIDDGKALNEEHGQKLAEWAAGKKPEPKFNIQELEATGEAKASLGVEPFKAWWEGVLTKEQRVALKGKLEAWKTAAAAVKPSA
jgi:energy-coupling factor transporter ATP-binding protein EcfA2